MVKVGAKMHVIWFMSESIEIRVTPISCLSLIGALERVSFCMRISLIIVFVK